MPDSWWELVTQGDLGHVLQAGSCKPLARKELFGGLEEGPMGSLAAGVHGLNLPARR